MSETTQTEKMIKEKTSLTLLRERRGGMSDELKEYFKEQQRIRKALREALKGGAKSVPEIAAACSLDKQATLWHLMAMRRYGEVVEASEQNNYPLYALKEV
jgi:predicted RNA binding protein with dsRBD fold (UPF0201 family)